MAFPANRATSQLNTLYGTAFESVEQGVQDIVFKESTLLSLAMSLGLYKVEDFSHHHLVPVVDTNDNTVTPFVGWNTLPTDVTQGARPASFAAYNYAASVGISWDEQQNIKSPHALVDLMETRAFKAYRAIGSILDRDMFWGNTSDALRMNGLEQAIWPKLQETSSSTNILKKPRWGLRQANNTYGEVARSAYTADDVGGTGWENLSMDMTSTGGTHYLTASSFAVSGGVPNDALKALGHMYQLLGWGNTYPDLIISGTQPYEDYMNAQAGYIQYVRTSGTPTTGDLGFTSLSYRGAQWVQTERCVTSGAGDSTANLPCIYLLNTKTLRLKVADGGDFVMTDFKQPLNQAGAIAQLLWRGNLICVNPRFNGIMYKYGN